MKKKLSWRLSKLPTPDELRELVKDKIITHEEAKEVLFKEETQEEVEVDDLKSEIKFLRDLVKELSNNQRTTIVEKIREVQVPYRRYGWYPAYDLWCQTTDLTGGSYTLTASTALNTGAATTAYVTTAGSGTDTLYISNGDASDFSKINTFN